MVSCPVPKFQKKTQNYPFLIFQDSGFLSAEPYRGLENFSVVKIGVKKLSHNIFAVLSSQNVGQSNLVSKGSAGVKV